MQQQASSDWDILQEVYDQVEGAGGGGEFTPLPTGKYQAIITQNQFDTEKFIFERKFKVMTGPEKGRTQTDWIRLFNKDGHSNEFSLDRIKAEMRLLDADFPSIPLKDSWPPFCESSLDQCVNIYVSTKDFKKNDGSMGKSATVYINEFVGRVAPGEAPQELVTEDDIPF